MAATVSVVIPCYQQAAFLREAIDSVLASTCEGVEVVVVNDGSTDDTQAVAQGFGDRVVLVEQENRGLSSARNAGLARATGAFVNFLDADDRLTPEFLGRMLMAADTNPRAAVLCGGWQLVDANGQVLEQAAADLPAEPYPYLLGGNPLPCHAVVVRREILDNAPPFDESLRALEDWDLWLRLARAGHEFVNVPAAEVIYRRYEGSMSRDVGRMLSAARTVLARHRGRHLGRRLRAMRAIRFGQFCENVLPEARTRGLTALLAGVWRNPSLVESALLYALLRCCPPLRRRLGVSERPFAAAREAAATQPSAGCDS
ncbi:MAG: glycosyltransferase [bacterium]|nr:glycosyltransferase [bacterium]